jgi:hypothetical protein
LFKVTFFVFVSPARPSKFFFRYNSGRNASHNKRLVGVGTCVISRRAKAQHEKHFPGLVAPPVGMGKCFGHKFIPRDPIKTVFCSSVGAYLTVPIKIGCDMRKVNCSRVGGWSSSSNINCRELQCETLSKNFIIEQKAENLSAIYCPSLVRRQKLSGIYCTTNDKTRA